MAVGVEQTRDDGQAMQIDDGIGWNVLWFPGQPWHSSDLAILDDQADVRRIGTTVLDIDNTCVNQLELARCVGEHVILLVWACVDGSTTTPGKLSACVLRDTVG